MKNHTNQLKKEIGKVEKYLCKDLVLNNDIEFPIRTLPPYIGTGHLYGIKLVIIGQDPTVENKKTRENIEVALNLNKNGILKTFLKEVCEDLKIDLEKEVYATNLYKCFFKNPPAKDQTILSRHFKVWIDILINELSVFNNQIFITLGEPVITQLVHSNSKEVKHYWDYKSKGESGKNFKCIEPSENYLQKRIYPLAHLNTCKMNPFYKKHLKSYLEYIVNCENL